MGRAPAGIARKAGRKQPRPNGARRDHTPAPAPPRGDEADLYRRHHRNLQRAVARAVNAPRELIEDACQTAWTIMLRSQPDRAAIFAWLRVVAIHEAYRLSRIHRSPHLEDVDHSEGWDAVIAEPRHDRRHDRGAPALERLAELPPRQRRDLALRVAGFTYREIAKITGGRTYTNVNKHLRKARAAGSRLEVAARREGPKRARHSS